MIVALIPSKNIEIRLTHSLSDRQKEILLAGGMINYVRKRSR